MFYSLGVELFVPFMPRHILEKNPDKDQYVIKDFTIAMAYDAIGYKG